MSIARKSPSLPGPIGNWAGRLRSASELFATFSWVARTAFSNALMTSGNEAGVAGREPLLGDEDPRQLARRARLLVGAILGALRGERAQELERDRGLALEALEE